MKPKQHEAEIKDAIAFLDHIKFIAYIERKACAKSGNPFAPIPGMESDFDEASNTIRRVNIIHEELDKRSRRRKSAINIASKAQDALMCVLITIGFLVLAWAGASFVGFYLDIKPIAMIIGISAVAVACEVINRLKARKRRK